MISKPLFANRRTDHCITMLGIGVRENLSAQINFRVSGLLFQAEALEHTGKRLGRGALIFVIPLDDGELFKAGAINVLKFRAVTRWVFLSSLGSLGLHVVNGDEREQKQKTDNGSNDGSTDHTLGISEVSVLPDDVGRLASILELKASSKKFLVISRSSVFSLLGHGQGARNSFRTDEAHESSHGTVKGVNVFFFLLILINALINLTPLTVP